MKAIPLKKIRRRFTAHRDSEGVPHIEAASWLDALYGLGYMHAIDRGTQLQFANSLAQGRGAEDISNSPELQETDRFFRKIGLYRHLDREVSALSDHSFRQLTAYCEGVNDGIQASPRSWPIWATGFQPRPWNQQSVLLLGMLLSFGGLAVSQLQNERLLVELIHAGASDKGLRELFAPRLDEVDLDMLRQVKLSSQLSDEALELITDLPRLAGSNAWVLSPRRSASGKALLASDPHLEINRLPAIWYEAVLRWDHHYVMGATLPGCPLFAVARTKHLAWGVTYMKGDTIDFFIEDCRRGGENDWQYRRGRDWLDFQLREEVIQRKGDEPETMKIYENEQGILDSDLEQHGSGYHLSVAWSGNFKGSGRAITTWLDVVDAEDAAEAMGVVKGCTQPTLCWLFADSDGHIGMQTCGRFPKRNSKHTGLTPIPAWDKKNHWRGWLSESLLPSIYDPPEGFIASANEPINPAGGPLMVTQPLHDYRKRRIEECLRELPSATIEDMKSMQYDLVSVQARELLEIFLPHLPEGQVKERLVAWDFSYDPDSRGAATFQKLYRNVLVEVFGHEEGLGWRRMLYLCSRAGFSSMVLSAADHLMAKEKSHWWSKRDKGGLIRKAAQRLESEADLTWGEVNNFHFTDRFFGAHQVGRMLGYNSRQYPMPGNFATLFQGHVLQTAKRETTFAPSYHFITDMSTDEVWTNLPGGPSENRFSKFYKNDISRWFTGEYKRMSVE